MFINMCGGNNNNRRLPTEKPVYEYVPREKTARKKRKYDDKDTTPKPQEDRSLRMRRPWQ